MIDVLKSLKEFRSHQTNYAFFFCIPFVNDVAARNPKLIYLLRIKQNFWNTKKSYHRKYLFTAHETIHVDGPPKN